MPVCPKPTNQKLSLGIGGQGRTGLRFKTCKVGWRMMMALSPLPPLSLRFRRPEIESCTASATILPTSPSLSRIIIFFALRHRDQLPLACFFPSSNNRSDTAAIGDATHTSLQPPPPPQTDKRGRGWRGKPDTNTVPAYGVIKPSGSQFNRPRHFSKSKKRSSRRVETQKQI